MITRVSGARQGLRLRNPGRFGKFSRGGSIAAFVAAAICFAFFLAGSLRLVSVVGTRLWLHGEIGYGDSYILYDVNHFRRTGIIYRDLSRPPYLPAQYSPFVYMMYAIPGGDTPGNPFFRPRMVALASFFASAAVVLSLVRALVPLRFSWLWGLVLLGSVRILGDWPLQLRGDFPAIFFSLASLRLLMSRLPHRAVLAGLCAGAAMQFKLTYVAAMTASVLWLTYRRRWKELALFVPAAAVTSLGIYIALWLREPAMLSQITALAPGISDFRGLAHFILRIVGREPLFLLALPAASVLIAKRRPHWLLLLLFAVVSFLFQAAADIQVGGNVNYFFESVFALVPVAVFGIMKLISWLRERPALAVSLTGVVFVHLLFPQITDLYHLRPSIGPAAIGSQNEAFDRAAGVLKGRRMLSFIPRLALLEPQPALIEPYLAAYMGRLGKFDATPLLERIARQEFDLVIIPDKDMSWRGVYHVRDMLGPIEAAYRLWCDRPWFLYLPRDREADSGLIQGLKEIGCEAR